MASTKQIPDFSNELIWPASDDLVEAVDVDDNTHSADGTTKRMKQANVVKMVPVTETSTDYTVTDTDLVILVDDTSAARTITINSAQHKQRRQLIIKDISGNAGTNHITVVTGGSKTFDGNDSIEINIDYGSLTLVGNSSNWTIIR